MMSRQSPLPEIEKTSPRKKVTMAEFIAAYKVAGEMAIPAADPIYTYTERAGIPDDFLELAWLEFRERHLDNPAKKYSDWRAAFRNAVRDNWYRLWRYVDGRAVLTTQGEQAARVHGKTIEQPRSSKFDPVAYVNRNRQSATWNNFDQMGDRQAPVKTTRSDAYLDLYSGNDK